MSDLSSNKHVRKVHEARLAYIPDEEEKPVVVTISSKNQITLPARLLRELGVGAGDKVRIRREGNSLIIRPKPKDWSTYYGGSMRGVYGNTKEEIDAYIRELRMEDPEKEKALEEAWAVRESRRK